MITTYQTHPPIRLIIRLVSHPCSSGRARSIPLSLLINPNMRQGLHLLTTKQIPIDLDKVYRPRHLDSCPYQHRQDSCPLLLIPLTQASLRPHCPQHLIQWDTINHNSIRSRLILQFHHKRLYQRMLTRIYLLHRMAFTLNCHSLHHNHSNTHSMRIHPPSLPLPNNMLHPLSIHRSLRQFSHLNRILDMQ